MSQLILSLFQFESSPIYLL